MAAPLTSSDKEDTSATAAKRSLEDGKPPYTVHLYVQKVATTIETITCDNYEELYAELLRRNTNWERDWPGSFGWINSNIPKKSKGKRSKVTVSPIKRDIATEQMYAAQVLNNGPNEKVGAFPEKESHDEVLRHNPNHDKEFPEEKQWTAKRSGFDKKPIATFDADASHTSKRSADIGKRYNGWEATPICNKDSFGGKADYNHINELMDTLLMQSGKPKVGAGPKKCAIAGCKDGNSIWYCNDVRSSPMPVFSGAYKPFLPSYQLLLM